MAIVAAEKDTAGAVLQMNIVNAKNSVLNEEYRNRQEINRENVQQ